MSNPTDSGQSHAVLSLRSVLLCGATALLVSLGTFSVSAHFTDGMLAWSDGLAYFLYARSAVLDQDLDITDEFDHLDARFPSDSKALEPLRKWSYRAADGGLKAPWPAGAGLVMTPFYAAGWGLEMLLARRSHRPPDSYGLVPQFGFALGSVVFAIIGLSCTVLLCGEIARPRVAHLASLAVVLCGPLVFFVFFHPTMAHASSFAFVALLTLAWMRSWRSGASTRAMIGIGLLLGVAATVRYQNGLFAILPVALVLRDACQRGIRASVTSACAGAAACLVPIALIVWPALQNSQLTGHSAVTAAGYPIDLRSPFFLHVLFSCRHGAFYWAPVLGIGVLGLLLRSAHDRGWPIVLLLAFAANVYLIGGLGLSTVAYADRTVQLDWLHHWDNAPSFGMRYLAECAPLYALGLAHLIESSARYVRLRWWGAALLPFAVWNALLILAYGLGTITRSGCLPYSDMRAGIVQALGEIGRHIF
jgi:hypothetical protein